jgi:signal transduction histidine kinase
MARRTEAARGITLLTKLSANLPFVWMNPGQIDQVIGNLLRNAIHSLDEAQRKRPVLQLLTRRSGPHAVEIAIRDNGTGIPVDLLPKISRCFITTKQSGNGIGLLLCRSVIEAHQGTLTAENNVRHGATFRMTLPVDPNPFS